MNEEINNWIAEHVYGMTVERGEYVRADTCMPWTYWSKNNVNSTPRNFAEHPEDAMLLLETCARKINERNGCNDWIQTQYHNGQWFVFPYMHEDSTIGFHSLPLAICHLAKQLYTENK